MRHLAETTHISTDIATYRLNRPWGKFSEIMNICLKRNKTLLKCVLKKGINI